MYDSMLSNNSFAASAAKATVNQYPVNCMMEGVMKACTLPFTAHSINCRETIEPSRFKVKSSSIFVSSNILKAIFLLLPFVKKLFRPGTPVKGFRKSCLPLKRSRPFGLSVQNRLFQLIHQVEYILSLNGSGHRPEVIFHQLGHAHLLAGSVDFHCVQQFPINSKVESLLHKAKIRIFLYRAHILLTMNVLHPSTFP